MFEEGHAFDPSVVGVVRAFHVARDAADKQAALERRAVGTRRMQSISQRADLKNTASVIAYSEVQEAKEDSALYGTPDEICAKIQRLKDAGVDNILLNGGGTSRENLRRFARDAMTRFR